jgi:methyl-accepting chemotaxis protein
MNKLAIGSRLALGFALVLVLALLTTIVGVWQLQTASTATQGVIEEPLAKERLIADWYLYIHTAVRRTTAIAKSSDASLATFFADEQKQSAASTTEIQKKIETLMVSDAEKTVFTDISAIRKTYTTARDDVIRLKKEGKPEEADKLLETLFVPTAKSYLSKVESLLNLQRKALDESAIPIKAANDRARNALLLLGGLSIALGATCALVITRSITTPLAQALDESKRVAAGDLTFHARTEARDETGHLLNALSDMQLALTRVIGKIRQSADNISTASAEIASGNQDLSIRTEQTASSLQETASSLEHLTSTVQHSAQAARTASDLAASAAVIASRGGEVVSQVVSTMDEINTSSRKISDIISVIDGIAFQTNILALNAAVEAARAGEQGRGFAVVASEVRSLAGRSAEAAREIKTLINASVEKVDNGAQLVREAGNTMEHIVQSVQKVTDVIGEIASAAAEQSVGIAQVNTAVNQLDKMTQQNAALVEQSAAAAHSLNDQASHLLEAVATFKLDGGHAVAPQHQFKQLA